MTCSWCEERFERFIDGRLTDGHRARLLLHVDRCATCRGLLEELRVVDALLLAPRGVELPADFTFATMAEVRALPPPQVRRAPVTATLVAYVVAAWSLTGAAFLIAPSVARATAANALLVAGTVFAAFGGLGHVLTRLGDRGAMGSWTTVAGGVVLADGVVLVAIAAALWFARPRIAERLRW